jgi:hypothetical protein
MIDNITVTSMTEGKEEHWMMITKRAELDTLPHIPQSQKSLIHPLKAGTSHVGVVTETMSGES